MAQKICVCGTLVVAFAFAFLLASCSGGGRFGFPSSASSASFDRTSSSETRRSPAPAEKRISFFSTFPICLSRACLGKMISFSSYSKNGSKQAVPAPMQTMQEMSFAQTRKTRQGKARQGKTRRATQRMVQIDPQRRRRRGVRHLPL